MLSLDFERLKKSISEYLRPEDVGRVEAAYHFAAAQAHSGQFRISGEPYITHPVAVTELVAGWRLDAQALTAALLHDVMEDTTVAKQEISDRFGKVTAELVTVSPSSTRSNSSQEEAQAENFRKMLLAMASDLRVILIKLADRLHNMRTLDYVRPSKQRRIASETLEIYAPIANRLGLNALYRELQELSFMHVWPMRYRVLGQGHSRGPRQSSRGRQQGAAAIEERLPQWGIGRDPGREKHLYGIYRKMLEKNLSFSQVLDIYGFRVIVGTPPPAISRSARCTASEAGAGKIQDYIAIPRGNGYQSLHTTLIGPFGTPVEVQAPTRCTTSPRPASLLTGSTRKTRRPSPSCSTRPPRGCSRCSSCRTQAATRRSFWST